MSKLTRVSVLWILFFLIVTGCSGKTADPIQPSGVLPDKPEAPSMGIEEPLAEALHELPGIKQDIDSDKSERILLGGWTMNFNPETQTVSVEHLREAKWHFKVTGWLQPPNCSDCIRVDINSYVDEILDVDVTIKNPSMYTPYDLRAIIFDDGIHELLNADSWTELWDIPLVGFPINPFKAFAKDKPNRRFLPGDENAETENLQIFCPDGNFAVQFAVDVSWPGNCAEPYSIENFIQTEPLHDFVGSQAVLEVDVLDWQDDVSQVTLQVVEIIGADPINFEQQSENTWSVTITNNTGAGVGEYTAIIKALSANSGDLALYNFDVVTVSSAPDLCNPDNNPPDTEITSDCPDYTEVPLEIILGVSGIDPDNCTLPEDLTYEWRKRKDGPPWGSWYYGGNGPDIIISGFSPGIWDIEIRARDETENVDLSPATCSFIIEEQDPCDPDNDPPDTGITSGCYDREAGTTSIQLGVSGSDPNDCTPSYSLKFSWRKKKDGGSWSSWSSYSSGSSITVDDLSAGVWDIEVKARDLSYNEDTTPAICDDLTIEETIDPCDPDNDPPNTLITSGCQDYPAGTQDISLGVSGEDPNDCTVPHNFEFEWRSKHNPNPGTWSDWNYAGYGPYITITDLYAGNWDIQVRAYDESHNVDPDPIGCNFTIEDDGPYEPPCLIKLPGWQDILAKWHDTHELDILEFACGVRESNASIFGTTTNWAGFGPVECNDSVLTGSVNYVTYTTDIEMNVGDTCAMYGPIYQAWVQDNLYDGRWMGFPKGDQEPKGVGDWQKFEGGHITSSSCGAFPIRGAIHDYWMGNGDMTGPFGPACSGETNPYTTVARQEFKDGWICHKPGVGEWGYLKSDFNSHDLPPWIAYVAQHEYYDGQNVELNCKLWARKVVESADDYAGCPGTGLDPGYEYGVFIPDYSNAIPGDLLQIGHSVGDLPNLHTAIILEYLGDGVFLVIDSNWIPPFGERVAIHNLDTKNYLNYDPRVYRIYCD